MDIDTFINQTNNTHVDEDGYYGAQCWDLVAKYARVVVGCPSFPTGSGGAEGLYRIFADPIPQYFDRIANNPNDPNQVPQKGDVIVWQASFSPPYGHTALVISANSSGVTVLEQNGNNPGGNAYIKTRSWVGVSGWLRPKKGTNMAEKIDTGTSRVLSHGVLGRNGLAGRSYSLDGSQGDPWVGGDLTNQFIQDIFLSPEARQWRDSGDANSISGINATLAKTNGLETELDAERVGSAAQLADLQGKFDELLAADKLKDQRILDLQKQVPGSTTVEQPVVTPDKRSLWQVIGDFLSQFKKG